MEVQVIQPDVLKGLVQLEIDTQIATAKQFPRNLKAVLAEAREMATLTPEIAESCNYSLPRKKFNQETGQYEEIFINGPSIRLAEILVSCYGNMRAAMRVVANDGKKITAQARCHDLQRNTAIEINTDRSILTSKGKTFSEDMQIVTGNAASAIAFRNAVYKIIPASFVSEVYAAAIEAAKPAADELPSKRLAAVNHFVAMGVTVEQVLKVMRVKSIEEIGIERLTILRGMATSISTGECTKDELFPPIADTVDAKGAAATKQTESMLKNK